MEPTDLHQTIAGQIHHMLPDGFTPGEDIGFEVLDADTLRVQYQVMTALEGPGEIIFRQQWKTVDVRYEHGPDLYTVIHHPPGEEPVETTGLYCDQLGEQVFGEELKPKRWTQSFGAIIDPTTGEIIAEF